MTSRKMPTQAAKVSTVSDGAEGRAPGLHHYPARDEKGRPTVLARCGAERGALIQPRWSLVTCPDCKMPDVPMSKTNGHGVGASASSSKPRGETPTGAVEVSTVFVATSGRSLSRSQGAATSGCNQQYPGDEPCACGAVTITGHYLSSMVGHAEDLGATVHYRASDGTPCEETP